MDFLFEPAPAREVAAWIRAKAPMRMEQFKEMLPELQALGFAISGITAADALQDIRATIATLPEGETFPKVQKALAAKLSRYTAPPSELIPETEEETAQREAGAMARAKMLLRIHGNQAFAVATHQNLVADQDILPYWQYVTVGDENVRETHAALEGLVLPADHEFWKTHFPPWEFGCRCQVVPMTKEEHDRLKESEQDKPPEERQTLDEAQDKQLTDARTLYRNVGGVPTPVDLRAPIETDEEDPYVFNPFTLRIPLKQIKARYDAETYAAFEDWARSTKLDSGATVYQWLSRTLPRERATKKVEAPAGDFPSTVTGLKEIRGLGGSTGAKLVADAAGRRFVMKRGSSPEHLREEATADALYRALGVPVAPSKLYETAHGPAKLAQFLDGRMLNDYLKTAAKEQREAVMEKIRSHFVADALLGNWDVAGLDLDNILIDQHGTPWRIDNGGALRFRAQGAKKTTFASDVPELKTLRDAAVNRASAKIFAGITDADIAAQIGGILDKREELLAAAPEDLRQILSDRLDHLAAQVAPQTGITPGFSGKVRASRLSGVTFNGDRDLIEDTNILCWEEKDVNGAPLTRMKLRLTGSGSDSIVQTLGDELKNVAPIAQGRRTVPGDVYWSPIENALKTINHHAGTGTPNAAKVQAMTDQVAKLQAMQSAKKSTPDQKAMAAHYLDVIAKAQEALTNKSGTAMFQPYEPPPPPQNQPERRPAVEVKAETLGWNQKSRDRGYARREQRSVWQQQAYRIGDDQGYMHFIPWREANGSPSSAPYAFRGLVEVTVPGEATKENLQKAAELLRHSGVDIAGTSPHYNELVYLSKGLDLQSYGLDAAKNDAWRAIAGDAQLDDAAKVTKLKQFITGELKQKLGDNYQPGGKANSFGDGWKTWERWDLPRAEIEKKLKGYGLTHSVAGDMVDVLDSILSGGGQFTPTMERLRAGVSVTAGMSPQADMSTGGANYLFTRIRSEAGVDSHRGFVFKIGNLARMDNFSYNGDKFGDVRPPGEGSHGVDPRRDRARTIAEFKANARRSSNETIFKNGFPFLDEIDQIRTGSSSTRARILDIFRKHKYTHLPDGRPIEDVVKA